MRSAAREQTRWRSATGGHGTHRSAAEPRADFCKPEFGKINARQVAVVSIAFEAFGHSLLIEPEQKSHAMLDALHTSADVPEWGGSMQRRPTLDLQPRVEPVTCVFTV